MPRKGLIKKNILFAEQKMILLLQNPEFAENVKKIRKKLKIKPGKKNFGVYPCNPDLLYEEADRLLVKYDVPLHYRDAVVNVIMREKIITGGFSKFKIKLHTGEKLLKEENLNNRLFVEVFADTTINDLQNYFKEIKKQLRNLPGYKTGRNRISPKLERDLEIKKMRDKKISNAEISKNIKDQSITMGDAGVSKRTQRIKKKIKKA
jgi:hypothetical protein